MLYNPVNPALESSHRKQTTDDISIEFEILVIYCVTDYEYELLVWPAHAGWLRKTAWITTWPIHLVFMCTIPDCEKPRFKNWFPITFLMCIIWIGSLSYVVAWMITIIGEYIFNLTLTYEQANTKTLCNRQFDKILHEYQVHIKVFFQLKNMLSNFGISFI